MINQKLTRRYFFYSLLFCTSIAWADLPVTLSQTIQISTHFDKIVGEPTWLLIIRDMNSGQVIPYMFDIRSRNNFWVAFSGEHTYRITVSSLKFGPCTTISNFCHLENGTLFQKSFIIRLSGRLTPNPFTSTCHVLKYKDIGLSPFVTNP